MQSGMRNLTHASCIAPSQSLPLLFECLLTRPASCLHVQDLVNNLVKHRTTLQSHGKPGLTGDPAMASTWELVRLLKVGGRGLCLTEQVHATFSSSLTTHRMNEPD